MDFRLFDAVSGGNQIGAPIFLSNVEVKTSSFTVRLDFGEAAFPGADRFIEIGVRRQGDSGPFQTINPRSQMLSTPYAIRSLSAGTADSVSENCVGCVKDAHIQSVDGSKVAGTVANATSDVIATNSENADTLDNLDSSEFVQTNTTAFIRDQTTQQPANFNISGTGKANIIDAAAYYSIDGFRVFSAPTGTANLYAGFASGNNPGTGTRNSAFGYYAGESTNAGGDNSFFGHFSGRFAVGSRNSFYGTATGYNTRAGNDNTFIGGNAGLGNTVGSNNTLLGSQANVLSPDLTFATAIGAGATVNRNNQIVLGRSSGQDDVVIAGNTYVTKDLTVAGTLNGNLPSGSGNYIQNTTTQQTANFNINGNGTVGGTLSANGIAVYPTSGNGTLFMRNRTHSNFSQVVFADNFNQYRGYMGYIGLNAGLGSRNDTVEFGSNAADITFRPYETEVMRLSGDRVGIGTTSPTFKLEIVDPQNTGIRVQTNRTGGTVASFGGNGAFAIDAPGQVGGRFTVLENGNVGIGTSSPTANKLEVSGGGTVRAAINSDSNAGLELRLNNQPKWSLVTHSGGYFSVFNANTGLPSINVDSQSNVGIGVPAAFARLSVGGSAGGVLASFGSEGEFRINSPSKEGGRLRIFQDGTVWINDPPLDLPDDTSTKLVINGVIKAGFRDAFAGGTVPLCHNSESLIVTCGSSIRFKSNVANFSGGLDVLRELRPVSFDWKQDGMPDVGLIAEEVNKVDPRFVIHNDIGQVEGVKYNGVGMVLINAVKEQQSLIENQQKLIQRLEKQVDALKLLVCEANSRAKICRQK